MTLLARSLAITVLALASPAEAQTVQPAAPRPDGPYGEERRTNSRVVQIQMIQATPGGRHRLNEIIYRHFLPAMREAAVPPYTVFDPDSGDWDYIIIRPLDGGYTELGHTTTASDARWLNVLARREGSQKAADALEEEFIRLIARREIVIAHEHVRR